MTNTLVVSAVAVGGSAAIASNQLKTTLQTTTTVVSIHAQLTNGAKGRDSLATVRVYCAISPFSMTAAQAVDRLKKQAFFIDVLPDEAPGAIIVQKSDLWPADGLYAYTWTDEPKLAVAGTLSVNLTEI